MKLQAEAQAGAGREGSGLCDGVSACAGQPGTQSGRRSATFPVGTRRAESARPRYVAMWPVGLCTVPYEHPRAPRSHVRRRRRCLSATTASVLGTATPSLDGDVPAPQDVTILPTV